MEGIEDEGSAQKQLWMRISEAIKGVLDNTTLEDLAGYPEDDDLQGYMFYI